MSERLTGIPRNGAIVIQPVERKAPEPQRYRLDDGTEGVIPSEDLPWLDVGWRTIDAADVPHFIDNHGRAHHAAESHAAPVTPDLSAFDSIMFDEPEQP